MPVANRPRGARWTRTRLAVFERDRWRCQRCRKPVVIHPGGARLDDTAEADHVRPLVDGGDPWSMRNLQTLCAPCHSMKGTRTVDYRWPARRRRIMLVVAACWVVFMILGPHIWPG